jgi:hypothetical protein
MFTINELSFEKSLYFLTYHYITFPFLNLLSLSHSLSLFNPDILLSTICLNIHNFFFVPVTRGTEFHTHMTRQVKIYIYIILRILIFTFLHRTREYKIV